MLMKDLIFFSISSFNAVIFAMISDFEIPSETGRLFSIPRHSLAFNSTNVKRQPIAKSMLSTLRSTSLSTFFRIYLTVQYCNTNLNSTAFMYNIIVTQIHKILQKHFMNLIPEFYFLFFPIHSTAKSTSWRMFIRRKVALPS